MTCGDGPAIGGSVNTCMTANLSRTALFDDIAHFMKNCP